MYKLKVIQIIITNVHHHVAYIRHSPRGPKVTKTGKKWGVVRCNTIQRFSSDTSEYSSSKAVSDISACMMIDKDFFRQKGEQVSYTSRWLFAESSRDVRRVNLPWLSFSMCLLDSPHNFGQDLHLHWRS